MTRAILASLVTAAVTVVAAAPVSGQTLSSSSPGPVLDVPYVPQSETIVQRCIRRGVDVAPMHVDVCTKMPLFGWQGPPAPGAEKAMTAVQVPVYESLSDEEIDRVGRLVREQVLAGRR